MENDAVLGPPCICKTPENGRSAEKVCTMSSEWYYARNGQQYGPLSDDELRRLAVDRKLRPDDLLWREGMSDWKPANSVRGLFTASSASAPTPVPKAEKSANEKFCQECGSVIRLKAEICPQCGVRQPFVVGQDTSLGAEGKDARGMLTTPVLISAIGNVAIGCVWISTICGIPIGIAMIVLCVFEFMFYSDSDRLSPDQLVRKSGTLAICEIVCGLFNLVSLVCGILLLINKGKYHRSLVAGSM